MILMVLLSPLGLLALLLSMERFERWTLGDGTSETARTKSAYADGTGPTVRATAPQ